MNNKKASYKLLSLDLDGTLLSGVMRKAKKADCLALQDFMECGGITLINTGRAPWAVVKAVRQINKYGKHKIKLISCWNGAYIKDLSDNTVYEKHITHEKCLKILNIAKQFHGIKTWFYSVSGLDQKRVECWPDNKLLKWIYTRSKLSKIKNLNDLASYKIVIFGSNKKQVQKIYQTLINQKLNDELTIIHTSDRLIEITANKCSKGYAIDTIANKHKINKNEIVALGDSFNDLCAFNHSALSIAINPKNKNLLQHVNKIVKNKNKPIAIAINKYILEERETR